MRYLFSAVISVTLVFALAKMPGAQTPNGADLFKNYCAGCHVGNTDARTPTLDALRQFTADAIVTSLTNGTMREQGSPLNAAQRRAVADFLAASAPGAPGAATPAPAAPAAAASVASGADPSIGRCNPMPAINSSGPQWNGWGAAPTNTRFQSANEARLTPDQVAKLKLKWAFGFANASSARAQPSIIGGRLVVGGQAGNVYALDAKTGCTIWTFRAAAPVRTGISFGPRAGGSGMVAYFGDTRGSAYAVDLATGTQIWTRVLETHPSASVTGSPVLYQDRLYVPMSSLEETQGGNPKYECCKFRGSVAALNVANGEVIWKTYVMPEPQPIGKNQSGTTRYGPSGGAIWSAPTVDPKRGMVYAATGNQYTEPPQSSTNAMIAFEMKTGKIAWIKQATPNDLFVMNCGRRGGANCPTELGPDFDFGNAPILATLPGGRDLIVVGQKSGIGWAFDPDKQGAVVWQYQAGRGSALGGMEWGSAVDSANAYFAVSDLLQSQPGGLHAVRLDNGQRAWFAPPPAVATTCTGRGCSAALSAALTVIPGVVFAGSMDGAMRAYSTKDGSMIWEFDTNREFTTVNGVPAKGASINGPGPAVVDGMMFVNSGYGALGGRPGNVLLAFAVE